MQTKHLAILSMVLLGSMTGCAVGPVAGYYPAPAANTEYQRGYNDGAIGTPADKFRRNPAYDEGYRNGQALRTSPVFNARSGRSPDYNRGFDDAVKGNYYDPYNHSPDYQAGYHDGQKAIRR